MKKNISWMSIAALAIFFSGHAVASGPTGSLGYTHYDLDAGVELGAIYGSVGYDFGIGQNLIYTPELRAGFGVRDDNVFGGSIKLSSLYGVANRFTYHNQSGLYFFASISYVSYKLEFRNFSNTSWEPGYGGGIGFDFNERVGLELMYENVDSSDAISAAFRFRF